MTDKFSTEVHRRLCAIDESKALAHPLGPLGAVVDIANDVAREHPAWFERFRIGAMLKRLARRFS
jgi:hypothetical protein